MWQSNPNQSIAPCCFSWAVYLMLGVLARTLLQPEPAFSCCRPHCCSSSSAPSSSLSSQAGLYRALCLTDSSINSGIAIFSDRLGLMSGEARKEVRALYTRSLKSQAVFTLFHLPPPGTGRVHWAARLLLSRLRRPALLHLLSARIRHTSHFPLHAAFLRLSECGRVGVDDALGGVQECQPVLLPQVDEGEEVTRQRSVYWVRVNQNKCYAI